MILLIDNYDSFSYNLVQLIGGILKDENSDEEIKVVRNDEITIDEVKSLKPSHLILSPGPGRPADAGICEAVIPEMMKTTPILGVCPVIRQYAKHLAQPSHMHRHLCMVRKALLIWKMMKSLKDWIQTYR